MKLEIVKNYGPVPCLGCYSLPKPVKRRIKALKKLQFEATKIEAEFYREVHKLECKYATRYAPLYEKVRFVFKDISDILSEST